MVTILLDQREQRFPDADQRSCCKREIADLSVQRRRDMGMLQIELCLLDRSLRPQHISALVGLLGGAESALVNLARACSSAA